jgi:hypothetical protein
MEIGVFIRLPSDEDGPFIETTALKVGILSKRYGNVVLEC